MLKRLIRNKQDLYSLEFLHKSWNLRSNFTDLEKVWKIEIKSWKNGKIPVFFFQSYNKWFKSVFFLFCSNVIQSCPYVCSAPWKTLVFLRFLRSLFKNLSLEKEITVLKKSLESVEFWVQKSVRTLNKRFSSFICYRERALINDYFTLLASLEYNMQEIQKVQKLANDLVDITVTVR